jgi:hypothetical protein
VMESSGGLLRTQLVEFIDQLADCQLLKEDSASLHGVGYQISERVSPLPVSWDGSVLNIDRIRAGRPGYDRDFLFECRG